MKQGSSVLSRVRWRAWSTVSDTEDTGDVLVQYCTGKRARRVDRAVALPQRSASMGGWSASCRRTRDSVTRLEARLLSSRGAGATNRLMEPKWSIRLDVSITLKSRGSGLTCSHRHQESVGPAGKAHDTTGQRRQRRSVSVAAHGKRS